MIELNKINWIKAEIINFRNMEAIQFIISSAGETKTANVVLPRIKEKSPALGY